LGTATASFSSGLILAATSYAVLGLVAATLAVLLLAWNVKWMIGEGRLVWAWPPFGGRGPEPCPTC
jgi:hypothetical protein